MSEGVENQLPTTTVIDGETVDISHLSDEERATLGKADAGDTPQSESLEDIANGAETPNTETGERPEWLDEKFESPEDLAKAYKELQAKLSAGEKQEETSEETSEGEATEKPKGSEAIDFERYTNSINENGALSEDDYKTLEAQGYPKELVDVYVEGLKARTATHYAPVFEAAGGEEAYNELIDWAGANLSDDEAAAYDALIQKGGTVGATAIKQLLTLQGGTPAARTVRGNTTTKTVEPFESQAQITVAMRDPRYRTDPAYQALVAKRVAISSF